jgi:hypothetical protein
MFLYVYLIDTNIARNMPAVMDVGIRVASIDARDEEPESFESCESCKLEPMATSFEPVQGGLLDRAMTVSLHGKVFLATTE